MKIFVDENIPLVTVQELVSRGHDVIDIRIYIYTITTIEKMVIFHID